jgi:hypothetical protein
MKTKGITIWERHAEKLVLALAGLLFVAFAAMQFVGEPNAVTTPAGAVAPRDIDALLEDRALQLLGRLSDEAEPGVELPDPEPAIDQLRSDLNRSLSPAAALKPFTMALAPSVEGIGPAHNVEFPVPQIKPPDRVAIGQTADALADGVVEQFPDLQELFPDPDQPHDITILTIAANVDLADVREQYRAERIDPETQAPAVIPTGWFGDRPENIVDVVIQRQELLGGEWTNLKVLDPIPGQFSFRSQLAAGELDAVLRDDVLGQLSDPALQLALVQPAFYALKNEDLSIPVIEDEEVDEEALERDEQINAIRTKIRNLERRRDAKLQRLEDLGGTRRKGGVRDDERGRGPAGGAGRGGGPGRREPPGKGKRDAPGKGAGGFGEGGDDIGKRGDPTGSGRIDKKVEDRLNREIDALEFKIALEYQRLRDLGVDVAAEEQDQSRDPLSVLQEDRLMVFGHDLYVQPGQTYRYRVAVRIYNPFFGKKRSLVESQEHLAESFTLDSATSDWSAPVRVNPPLRVFITHASPPGSRGAGALGLGRATAEVYRFYDGRHWMETFAVSPGGYIGGVREQRIRSEDGSEDGSMEIDFRTDLFVLDIVPNIDAGRGRRAALPEAGKSARVLLQDFRTGEVLELRDPRTDLIDPDRLRLRDTVEATAAVGSG